MRQEFYNTLMNMPLNNFVGTQAIGSNMHPTMQTPNGLVGGPKPVQRLGNFQQGVMVAQKGVDDFTDAVKSGVVNFLGNNAEGIIGVAGGAMNLAQNFLSASQIQDTPQYDNAINDIARVGKQGGYTSFDQLAADYNSLGPGPNVSYDEIRGMSDGEQLASIGSSMLTGATAGAAFGPWGALGGAVVGLGTGIGGVLTGNQKAREKVEYYKGKAQIAQDTAYENLNAAHEAISDKSYRQKYANVAKDGGAIRRQESIKEFAARAMRRPLRKSDAASTTPAIVHRKENGGTVIRIKR